MDRKEGWRKEGMEREYKKSNKKRASTRERDEGVKMLLESCSGKLGSMATRAYFHA